MAMCLRLREYVTTEEGDEEGRLFSEIGCKGGRDPLMSPRRLRVDDDIVLTVSRSCLVIASWLIDRRDFARHVGFEVSGFHVWRPAPFCFTNNHPRFRSPRLQTAQGGHINRSRIASAMLQI